MEEEIIKQERKPESKPEGKPETALPERVEQTESFQALIRGKYREDYLQALGEALAAQAQETERYLAYRELQMQARALRTEYPDFDLDRELENPAFVRLLNSAVDPRTAYEVVHHRELCRREAQLARNAARPQENGLAAAPAALARPDPRALSPQERKALRRRAAKGGEIVW